MTYTKKKTSKANKTRKNFRKKLEKIYPKCLFDNVDQSYYKNDKITYGEMNYEGLITLYALIDKYYKNISAFLDIGSGRGKLCLYMASYPKIKKVVGIEIVESRHNDALQLAKSIKSSYLNKINLINDDIMNIDLKNIFSKPTFVWWSNLCFHVNKSKIIFEKLLNELPKGSVICFSKDLGLVYDIVTNIPMSWYQNSNVNIYSVK